MQGPWVDLGNSSRFGEPRLLTTWPGTWPTALKIGANRIETGPAQEGPWQPPNPWINFSKPDIGSPSGRSSPKNQSIEEGGCAPT
jgi:hypothetical protein